MSSLSKNGLLPSECLPPRCIAFAGNRRVAAGPLAEVVTAVKQSLDHGEQAPIVILSEDSSELVEIDFRGKLGTVLARLEQRTAKQVEDLELEAARRGRGRPRLGVMGREVTLLPRHWQWLDEQPGGASAALRRLVETGKRANAGKDRVRKAKEAMHRFLTALAGDLPWYEESLRALYASEHDRFESLTAVWPADVRAQAKRLLDAVIQAEEMPEEAA